MPRISSIAFAAGVFTIGHSGTSVAFLESSLPGGVTVAQAESTINTWLTAHVPADVGVLVVHVFSVAPLRLATLALDPGQTPRANWWIKS